MSGARLRSASLAIPCPACGNRIRTTCGALMDEVTVVCPRGHRVRLVDNGDGVRRLDRTLNDLNRQLRRLSRR